MQTEGRQKEGVEFRLDAVMPCLWFAIGTDHAQLFVGLIANDQRKPNDNHRTTSSSCAAIGFPVRARARRIGSRSLLQMVIHPVAPHAAITPAMPAVSSHARPRKNAPAITVRSVCPRETEYFGDGAPASGSFAAILIVCVSCLSTI